MRTINTEFYGDDSRWFIGEVKGINDPARLGRVRVRVFGLHTTNTSKIALTDLPWANVVIPVTQGGVAQVTQPTGIQIGARVFGVFLDGGHSQVPLILGSIPSNSSFRIDYDGPPDNFVVPVSGSTPSQQYDTDPDSNDPRGTDQRGGSGNASTNLIGQGRQEQAFNFLKQYFQQRGHNNPGYIAAAFVGNFINESGAGLPPNAGPDYKGVKGNNTRWGQERSFGIAQWNLSAGRMGDLEVFVARPDVGTNWANFTSQLRFVTWELENTHSYVYTWLQEDQTIEAATETVMAWYENPAVSVNFKTAHAEAKSWRKYQRAGGIQAFLRRNSRQGTAISAYSLEFRERVGDAKAVYNTYGG
jgi:hypothetical protein